MDQKTIDDYIIKTRRKLGELENQFDDKFYAGREPPPKPILTNLPLQIQVIQQALSEMQQPQMPNALAEQMPPGAINPPMR